MTRISCRFARRAFGGQNPKLWRRLTDHAAGCSECRERLSVWERVSAVAPALKKEWESPELFPGIVEKLAAERNRRETRASAVEIPVRRRPAPWLPIAAGAALVLIAMIGLQVFRDSSGKQLLVTPELGRDPLMSEKTIAEVDAAETAYVRSIEKLSALARPKIENPTSPLLVNYREKLLLLDSAISDLRAEIGRNRFNTHLRRELLVMYREKQRTLQDLMKEGQS